MDLSVAKTRWESVTEVDSMTVSRSDFLATHVPLRKIGELSKFDISPTIHTYTDEEEIYKKYVINPSNRHQLIVVYGQSGTGKSHLIRWLNERFENEKNDDEVVLFVRRSDNTLKGTIKQLLEKEEVKNIENKNLIKRLTEASSVVAEDVLKSQIYYQFLVYIENDDESREFTLKKQDKKRLTAFLKDDRVRELFMDSDDGPIERIYSKIAENTVVIRDTEPRFQVEDFMRSRDLLDEVSVEGDNNAKRFLRKLNSDEGEELAKRACNYINQFVPEIIQYCAGIEPGDFEQIFMEIRKELYRQNKSLTLFIDDITSFTGVDISLLNALMETHNGREICRITSVIGATNSYINENFKDNHLDRVSQFVYIPDNAFDQEARFELVARYLNTMSLPESTLQDWLEYLNAQPQDYPIHDAKQGKGWDYFTDSFNRKMYLYPFSKHSIEYLYWNALVEGNRSPRYIITDIIWPVVQDILEHREQFPSRKFPQKNTNSELSYLVNQSVHDQSVASRLIYFMTIWGNGQLSQYNDHGETYISGIPAKIYEEFHLPSIQLTVTEKSMSSQKEEVKKVSKVAEIIEDQNVVNIIADDKKESFNNAQIRLENWVNGEQLHASGSGGAEGTITTARKDMCNFLWEAIDWQNEGFSMDDIEKIKNSTSGNGSFIKLLAFANQVKGKGIYTLPADLNSKLIIEPFIRWRLYGQQSWRYPGGMFDVLRVTSWVAKIKKELIDILKTYGTDSEPVYIECAIVMEYIRKILNGELKRKKRIQHLTLEDLLSKPEPLNQNEEHGKKWQDLLGALDKKKEENRKTILNYFNIIQGKGGKVVVLNYPKAMDINKKVLKSSFVLRLTDLQLNDPIVERRNICSEYKKTMTNIEKVWEEEFRINKDRIQCICENFELEDDDDELEEEDINDLIDQIRVYQTKIDQVQINIPNINIREIARTGQSRTISNAVKTIRNIKEDSNIFDGLMSLTGNSLGKIGVLSNLIQTMNPIVAVVEKDIIKKKLNLANSIVEDHRENFIQEKEIVQKNLNLIEELEK